MAKDDRVEGADVPVCVHGGSGVQHLPQPVVIGLLLDFKKFLSSFSSSRNLKCLVSATSREGDSNSS